MTGRCGLASGAGRGDSRRRVRAWRALARLGGAAAVASYALAGAFSAGSPPHAGQARGPGDVTASASGGVTPREVTGAGVLNAVRSARGDVVLVNVWATWCDPCRHEFPALLKVREEFAREGFRLILVSADFADQLPKVEEFLSRQGVGFPTFLKAEDDMAFINALDARWSGALPASFLYDRDSVLNDFWVGESSYESLAKKVKALLGSGPERGAKEGSR